MNQLTTPNPVIEADENATEKAEELANAIPLKTFLETPGISQGTLAKAVGLAQSAISKMLKTKRNIFVHIHDGGLIELREKKTKTIAISK